MKRTKIIVTMGPSVANEDMIKKLILAGVNAFRFNFSHGTYETHGENFKKVRDIANDLKKPVALIQDLAGPKIRIKEVVKPFNVRRGDQLCILKDCPMGDSNKVGINYPEIIDKLVIGSRVYLADGQIAFKAIKKVEGGFCFEALNDGVVSSRKGLNFPDIEIELSALSEKDKEDIEVGIKMGFDYIALSFVKNKNDIQLAKNLLAAKNANIPIIAKIEKHESLKNLDEIIETADAIMIARGDLGIEVDIENIPVIQKEIIHKCNRKGKPVITATQMLTSMIFNLRPTRAEVNDIGNAVLDGSDALMLSDETTIGKHPLEAVNTMVKTIEHTESIYRYYQKMEGLKTDASIAYASCDLAEKLSPKFICVYTQTGTSARLISMFRPNCDILANVYDIKTYNRLALVWGITPYLIIEDNKDLINALKQFVKKAFEDQIIDKNALVIAVMGYPSGVPGSTNLIRVLRKADFEEFLKP